MTQELEKDSPFTVDPKVVLFVDYQINGVYEIPLKVTNKSSTCQRIKYIPPTTEYFSVRKVKMPSQIEG